MMDTRIILAAFLLAVPTLVLAQSSTATSGTTTPMTTAPVSNTLPNGRAADVPVEIKRVK